LKEVFGSPKVWFGKEIIADARIGDAANRYPEFLIIPFDQLSPTWKSLHG
jgi:hypothetical protein